MKKIHNCTGKSPGLGRILKQALTLAALLCAATSSQAQILINFGPNPVIDFNLATPPFEEWATHDTTTGMASTYADPAAVDAAAQTLDQSTIVTPLGTTMVNGTARLARHNTAGGYLVTQPTGVPFAMLKATLRNNAGGDISDITVTYDFSIPFAPTTDEVPGQRAYWSLSGLPNSWTLIPEFSGLTVAGPVSALLPLGTWESGADLYLLWLDDNNLTGADGAHAIDNFQVTATSSTTEPVVITTQPPASVTVPERGTAVFTVVASGSPQAIQWYRGPLVAGVAIPGATSPTYRLTPALFPGDNGAMFYAIISNPILGATSTVSTLTVVADTAAPTVSNARGEVDPTLVTINFSEPMDPAFINEANFVVFPTGTDPDATGLATFGIVLTGGTNVVLTVNPGRDPGVNYSVRIFDVRDTANTPNVINPNPTFVSLAQFVTLIGFDLNNEWKYSINEGDLGTAWQTVGFDDSTWPSGPAGLGHESDASGPSPGLNGVPIRTVMNYMSNGVPAYFRKHFSLPSTTNGVSLFLRDVVEDGAVYYLNGQEVFRTRMPAGPVTFTTLANGAPDPTPIAGPTSISITNLFLGDNVLAVEVHQSSVTSSDMEMAVEISALIPSFASGPATITGQPQSLTVNEGQNATFQVIAEGLLPLAFQWRKGVVPVDLPDQTNSTLTFASVVPTDAGTYSVRVSNAGATVFSANATLTVIPDLTAPAFLSAVGATNLTNITLVFSERLAASAQNTTSYNVQLTAGGGALTIESVVVTNGTNVILTTSPRTQSQNYTVTLSGITDTAVALNPAAPSSRPLAGGIIILAPDGSTVWRYNQTGADLDAAGWQNVGYDDTQAGWASGLAGLSSFGEEASAGFELRDFSLIAGTNVPPGPVTIYFRTHFTFPGNTNGAGLQWAGVVDDGAVFYVNGVRAGAIRLTNNPASYTNLASGSPAEVTNVFHQAEGPFLLSANNLVANGDNVLAVELHQSGTNSSDAVLSVQLIAQIADFQATVVGPPLRISIDSGTGQITISWTGGVGLILQETSALTGPSTMWLPSARLNGVPFTPLAGESIRFYRLRN